MLQGLQGLSCMPGNKNNAANCRRQSRKAACCKLPCSMETASYTHKMGASPRVYTIIFGRSTPHAQLKAEFPTSNERQRDITTGAVFTRSQEYSATCKPSQHFLDGDLGHNAGIVGRRALRCVASAPSVIPEHTV